MNWKKIQYYYKCLFFFLLNVYEIVVDCIGWSSFLDSIKVKKLCSMCVCVWYEPSLFLFYWQCGLFLLSLLVWYYSVKWTSRCFLFYIFNGTECLQAIYSFGEVVPLKKINVSLRMSIEYNLIPKKRHLFKKSVKFCL